MIDVSTIIANKIEFNNRRDQEILMNKTNKIKSWSVTSEELIRMMKDDPENLKHILGSGDVGDLYQMGKDGKPIWISVKKLLTNSALLTDNYYTLDFDRNIGIVQDHFNFNIFKEVFGVSYEITYTNNEYYFVKTQDYMNLLEYIQFSFECTSIRKLLLMCLIPIFGQIIMLIMLHYTFKFWIRKYVK